MKLLTEKDLKHMDYSTFVSLIKERNRPSGGIKTVQDVAVNAFINESKRILEIGSNTGFTSVNISLLTGCSCTGIDVNKDSVEEAKQYAKINGMGKKVNFLVANAEKLPFKDKSFDYVWCSNVTSFIKDKEKAIEEYSRVLKLNGTLIVVPIYYIQTPPENIVVQVSEAIGSEIKIWDKSFWLNLFEKIGHEQNTPLQLYYSKDFRYLNRKSYIKEYIEQMMEKEDVLFDLKTKDLIKNKLSFFMSLFNENLKYAGYSILLYQKRSENEETELFLSKENELN